MRRVLDSRPVVAVLALGVAFCASRVDAADPAASMLGRRAPSFRLSDVLSGRTLSLEDMRGRIVVLHFGTSW
jgi:hypothetical protein